MESYEQKYKAALEWMRNVYPTLTGTSKEDAEHFFPELAESEDEKIRKKLVQFFSDIKSISESGRAEWAVRKEDAKLCKAAIAYLEKQKEQKPDYCHHEVDLSGCSEEYRKGYYDGWNNCNQQHSQLEVEQKPAEWSEEDERFRTICSECVGYHYSDGLIKKETYEKVTKWLKSLRPQPHSEWRHYIWATNLRFDFTALIKYDNTDNYEIVQAGNRPKQERNGVYILIKDIKPQSHWKPSEEQMLALQVAAITSKTDFNILTELFIDLKKL